MRNLHSTLANTAKAALVACSMAVAVGTSALTIPNVPLSVQQSVKPLVMLVAGKDHRLFYEAYNDASDVDGDGTLDIRFKPTITYLGLFNPSYCYSHNGNSDNSGRFTPSGNASGANKKCSSGWSGNWLNYVTTSRIDALRVVLYGGHREVDSSTETILRRAYIPQDAHSWAKEYTSTAVDGYDIADYTPLSQPSGSKRHFFGNLTPNASTDCATLSNCSDLAPWLSVVLNSNKRVWEWASTERPVLADGTHGGTRTNYTVRVVACSGSYTAGCKQYPGGNWKPVGLLQDYGESDSMMFGLLTGSYDKNMSGGRLRKVVSSFKDEIDTASGVFTSNATIVKSFNAMRIRDFNNGVTNQTYKGGWVGDRAMASGEFPDWGNPMAEMMYEAVRYFAGKGSATSAYAGATTIDTQVGLPAATWDDPYSSTSAAKAPICARGNLLAISDVNVSYDSDQVPGVYSGFGSFSGDLSGLNVSTEATFISANEPDALGLRYIGQSATNSDSAPTAKNVADLGQVRGLAPEEPTKQGSYYSASVSYFAKKNDLRPDKDGKQNLDSFVVALASPLPRVEAKLPNGKKISVLPFAKSVGGAFGITNTKGAYQPTNQIVDFYVEQIANSGPGDIDNSVNGGRYYAKFRINFEDVEQGADHDMDAIVEYTIEATAQSRLIVTVRPTYQAGSIRHRVGYVISGTPHDGVYLVAQDESDETPYFLNVPPNRNPGFCDANASHNDCKRLPYYGAAGAGGYSSVTHNADNAGAASFIKDPLWYAAKWGGFIDKNANDKPDLQSEWDLDGDGVPDTYLFVQNPLKLKESLKKTLDSIASRSSSASNISANSTSISSSSRLYQAVFNTQRWSGDLIAYPATNNGVGATPAWEASTAMPAWSSRKIFMRNSAESTVLLGAWSSLSTADKALLVSSDVYEYLRGRRDKELQRGGNLRDREHALGDIVHSSPFYEKDSDTIYVGANDGMLHAFKGSDGSELFAFIPRASVSRMANIASLGYTHEYLVDGDVLVTPKVAHTNNKNYLLALLGRGGKGLFALNVTNPSAFATTDFLWEYTPAASTAAANDADLGLMLGRGIFTKLNNGKAGLVVGNGYNSTDGKAVLYIFILNADGSLASVRKIDTGAGGDNGLAAPALVDSNNDGTADYAYAGDLKGNVWKFDLSNANSSLWGVALSGNPLFVAKDPDGAVQPITAPMFTAVNDRGGDPNFGRRFVFFGSGSYFKSGDPNNTQEQSWYGIIDEGAAVSGRTDLRQRTIAQTGSFGGTGARAFSAATANDMSGKKGWYVDLDAPVVGERIVTLSRIVQFAVPALISSSLYPVPSDPCVPGGNGYLNAIDPYSGASLNMGILDVNKNNTFTDDKLGTNFIGSIDLAIGIPTEPLTLSSPGRVNIFIGGSGTSSTTGSLIKHVSGLGGNPFRGRLSWREIVKD